MIALFNGSPKATGSNTAVLVEKLRAGLQKETVLVSALKPDAQSMETLSSCEAVVLVFPLYVDALPSHLLRFLMEWEQYLKAQKRETALNFYAVAQCGFYEGKQNCCALELLSHFCSRAGIRWCGGIGLGGAGGMAGMPESLTKPLIELLSRLADTVNTGGAIPEPDYAVLAIPRVFYRLGAHVGWRQSAKKNGLGKKELYRKV